MGNIYTFLEAAAVLATRLDDCGFYHPYINYWLSIWGIASECGGITSYVLAVTSYYWCSWEIESDLNYPSPHCSTSIRFQNHPAYGEKNMIDRAPKQ